MKTTHTVIAHKFDRFNHYEFRKLARASRLKNVSQCDRSGRIMDLTDDEALEQILKGYNVYADVKL